MTTWTTFKGKKVSYETADHQHLSNCWWFMTIIHKATEDDKYIKDITAAINDRFNGQLLPYRPHAQFVDEHNYLRNLGVLFADPANPKRTRIVYKGVEIGEIIKF